MHLSSLLRVASFTVLVAACAAPARPAPLDPRKVLTQYGLDVWGIDQGIPNETVTSLVQTRDGYLWLGTYEGLARFDGVRFTTYATAGVPALRSNGVRALCEDAEGTLWIGTNGGGLTTLREGRFRHEDWPPLARAFVWAILPAEGGGVWVGTADGALYRLRGEARDTFTLRTRRTVTALAEDGQGGLWVATDGDGVQHLGRDGSWREAIGSAEGLPSPLVRSVVAASDGSVWMGTTGRGLAERRADGTLRTYGVADGLPSNNVWSLRLDGAGTLWVGTSGGLARRRGDRFEALTPKSGLPAGQIYALAVDREGGLWAGTNGGGLVRVRDGTFTTHTVEEGLAGDYVYAVLEDGQGLWVGTNGGLSRRRDGRWESFGKAEGLGHEFVRTLAADPGGGLWVGTYGGGLWHRDVQGRWTSARAGAGLAHDSVRAVMVDRGGTVWAATVAGVSRGRGGRWTTLTVRDGLPIDSTICVHEDRSGAVWIGTDGGGLVRLREGRAPEVFTTEQGLASGVVLVLAEDDGGTLWAGTNAGLSRFDGTSFASWGVGSGLPSANVAQIVDDGAGSLWLGTGRGLARIPHAALRGPGGTPLPVAIYGRAEGIESTHFTAPAQPGGWRARDGRLWLSTTRGVVEVDPRALPPPPPAPSVIIESVSADDRELAGLPEVTVEAGTKRIRVEYTAPALLPGVTRFRGRLEGFDADWVDFGERRAAWFTGVPAGSYVFRVSASTRNGPWSEPGAAIRLTIGAHPWQSPWFRGAAGLALALGGAAGYRLRVRRLLARSRELERLVEERTHRLAEGEKRFRSLLEAAPDAMVIAAADGSIVLVNSQAERLFGWPRAELLGRPLDVLLPGPAGGAAIPPPPALEGERTAHERTAVRRDGSELPVEVEVSPLATPDGPFAISAIRDISARRRLEEMRDDMTRAMVHDLRNPLTSVSGVLELLGTARLRETDGPELLGMALRSAQKMEALITSILDVGRLESGRLPLRREALPLAGAVRDALEQQRVLAEQRGVRLDARVPADVPPAWADAELIGRVLQNLVGNAIKFVEYGGNVRVAARRQDAQTVEVAVSDDGPGLAPGLESRLFQKFATGRHRARGSGLGLAFCRLAVEAHGGTIRAESVPGIGTTFTFTLPASDVAASPQVRRVDDRGHQALNVLVVDDDPVARKVATIALRQLGHSSREAADGEAAVAAVQAERFDVVLLDLDMPHLDGIAAARRIVAGTAAGSRPRLVAVTASARHEEHEACLAAGMEGCLSKPFAVAGLEAMLGRAGTPAGLESSPDAEASGAVVLDPARLEELRRLDPGMLREVVDLFLRQAPAHLAQMREAATAGDALAIRRAAHALRGSAATLGATSLAHECGHTLDDPEPASTAAFLDRVEARLRQAVEALRRAAS